MIEDCQGEIDKIRSELIEKYNQLPALEKKIVQLFSVIYEPVNRTALDGCVNYIGIRDENDNLDLAPGNMDVKTTTTCKRN